MHAQIIKLLQAYVPNQSLYRFLSKNNKPLVFIMGKRNGYGFVRKRKVVCQYILAPIRTEYLKRNGTCYRETAIKTSSENNQRVT